MLARIVYEQYGGVLSLMKMLMNKPATAKVMKKKHRFVALQRALEERGLELRYDSELCNEYINDDA